MKKFLIGTAVAATALFAAAPASAEIFAGADASGVGVQVGPFGVGVGPRFGWHDPYYTDGYYAYASDGYYAYAPGECRIVRERAVTPGGHVIYKRTRICD